ncbi:hypothetical protein SAZ_04805 [Streptomyces noursei ZPM]|uniref:Uncharacterized protein n=1 Tax=Streptomyces noursei TaxID=1971 RepID=A0A401QUC7_STRNR|nr:hypothetical protein [Streptomyces noursei]AKA01852.1 hypothetical protein SAZ_04805 [Streptomyces noursei ZPM]EOT02024.1 hypothetical protein K530_20841 [Streptomyces noursei CCRC 11814]EXU90022.1 hypothetical protein P354_18475 [Streptomyces noursei PD-1]GCB88994.1 hypothetical protein SALB_01667 [Streptomyces noursei]
MTHRRAAIPALVGALSLTLLLWWAGASAQALELRGTTNLLDIQSMNELRRWLTPWAYDTPTTLLPGDGPQYSTLHRTTMQIRFVAVFVAYLAGALHLVRRMPPTPGRTPATLLALWAWGPVAGTLAGIASAPWLIASSGHGSFRLLPQLASMSASSGPTVVFAALVSSLVTVVVARITMKDADAAPRGEVPPRAARLAASVGTAVIALSLVVLSYEAVAAWIQTSVVGSGLLSEPGDLLRQWLLLGGWSGPGRTPFGEWLLHRAGDVLMLAVVWWALRRVAARPTSHAAGRPPTGEPTARKRLPHFDRLSIIREPSTRGGNAEKFN